MGVGGVSEKRQRKTWVAASGVLRPRFLAEKLGSQTCTFDQPVACPTILTGPESELRHAYWIGLARSGAEYDEIHHAN